MCFLYNHNCADVHPQAWQTNKCQFKKEVKQNANI